MNAHRPPIRSPGRLSLARSLAVRPTVFYPAVFYGARAMDEFGERAGKHERDMAVGLPAHHVGRRSIRIVQADDHAGTLAAGSLRDQPITHTGFHGGLLPAPVSRLVPYQPVSAGR